MTTLPLPAPSPAPTCPSHPEKGSVGTCERCGRFMCADCMGLNAICFDCEARALQALPSLSTRGTIASVFLGIQGVALAVIGLVELVAGVPQEPNLALAVYGLMGVAVLVAFIGSVITFLMWVHLLARHAIARGAHLDATPGWAVGWFFVPFANLIKPYRVIKAAADHLSDRGGDAASVGAWWTAWILYGVLSNIESRFDSPMLGVISSALGLVGAVLCIRMMRMFQAALERRVDPALERVPSRSP